MASSFPTNQAIVVGGGLGGARGSSVLGMVLDLGATALWAG